MGSLALAGAIGGAGSGLREHVKGRRETRMQDDEQAHEVQLQIQRDKASETRATSRETFETGAADIRQEREVGLADVRFGRDVGLADTRYERDVNLAETEYKREAGLQERDLSYKAWETIRDNESEEFRAMFRTWSASHGSGAGSKGSAGDWDIEILPTFDETGPGTRMLSKHPSGISMEQIGERMVYVSDQELRAEGLAEFEDPLMQEAEERTLWNELEKGNDTGQEFLKEYKYLPHWYMVKKYETDNSNAMGGFWEFFNRNRQAGLPDFMGGRGLPRTTRELEAGIDPGVAPAEVAPAEVAPVGALSNAANAAAAAPAPDTAAGVAAGVAPVTPPQGQFDMPPAPPPEPPAPAPLMDQPPSPRPKSALETLANPERVGQGWRDLTKLIREKPWISNIISRYKRGLPISAEDEAKAEAFLERQRTKRQQ